MKLGQIKISDTLIKDYTLDLLPIMGRFVPIHIEIRPHLRDYVYTGISEQFEDIKEGDSIPTYDAIMTQHEDKTISVKFEKI